MPRAFLITHRRYNGTEEFQTPGGRDYSPERRVRLAEYVGAGQSSSDGASDCASESSSECPEELYNLTKLAEVSLAAAAGTLIRPRTVLSYESRGQLSPPQWEQAPPPPQVVRALRTVVVPAGGNKSHHHQHRDAIRTAEQDAKNQIMDEMDEIELSLRERTRLFFERIETERESLATRHRSSEETTSARHILAISSVDRSEEGEICSGVDQRRSSSSEGGSKSDDSEDHECPDCGKKYSTSSNLARHRQTHRSLGDKKARRCPHCDKIYVSMPAFSMHVRTHNQGCKCHYCGKCFSRPWLLQGHIRTHTGEKPFKCTICNKAFADKSNLRAHVQTHSNTKPHVCGRCGKAFALKSYLYKHEESSCMRAHHRSASEKNEPSTAPPGNPAILRDHRVAPVVVTASPTSVIVQCSSSADRTREPIESIALPAPDALPALDATSSSSIIRHTKNHAPLPVASKRHFRDASGDVDSEESFKISKIVKPEQFIPRRMVVRTSVISTNPESRRAVVASSLPPTRPFDFTDPSSSSSSSSSLSLAIA